MEHALIIPVMNSGHRVRHFPCTLYVGTFYGAVRDPRCTRETYPAETGKPREFQNEDGSWIDGPQRDFSVPFRYRKSSRVNDERR